MSDLKSLVEQRNDLVQQMKDLTAAVETEQRAFSDDEKTQFDELDSRVKSIDATIAAVESARALEIKDNLNNGYNCSQSCCNRCFLTFAPHGMASILVFLVF